MADEKMTEIRIRDILPDWKVYVSGEDVELTRHSPAGEEVCVSLKLGTAEEIANQASVYYDDFDPDDHAAQIYHEKHYGTDEQKRYYASAPDSLEDLVSDAHAIDNMYYAVGKALRDSIAKH